MLRVRTIIIHIIIISHVLPLLVVGKHEPLVVIYSQHSTWHLWISQLPYQFSTVPNVIFLICNRSGTLPLTRSIILLADLWNKHLRLQQH
ncbi:hypothetical protein BDV36DRAFT_278580, partial [Aspergillus pseudocaelatus]